MRTLSSHKNGFYVDIGAWSPFENSVTKAFYDKGWSGINVEPQPNFYNLLVKERPRDINLQLVLSSKPADRVSLWVPHYSALATCDMKLLDPKIPDYKNPIEVKVRSETLDNVLGQYVNNREIHFLKIDVEGHEGQVLSGADFSKYRPIVLVIESTCPHTNKPTWLDWEPQLLNEGYIFALFDGLNRFYVRKESKELLSKLAVPANCLDGFVSYREAELHNELNILRAKINGF